MAGSGGINTMMRTPRDPIRMIIWIGQGFQHITPASPDANEIHVYSKAIVDTASSENSAQISRNNGQLSALTMIHSFQFRHSGPRH